MGQHYIAVIKDLIEELNFQTERANKLDARLEEAYKKLPPEPNPPLDYTVKFQMPPKMVLQNIQETIQSLQPKDETTHEKQ